MDCFGTYLTHARSCDNVHVQSATDWAASVHTLHMPKAVIKFVFEVYGMDRWRTYLHMPKSVITFVFKELRNGLCFRRFRVFAVFAFSRFRFFPFPCLAFSRFRVPPAAPPRPGHRFRVHSYVFMWLFLVWLVSMFWLQSLDLARCHLSVVLGSAAWPPMLN